jgi:hypothetical protein
MTRTRFKTTRVLTIDPFVSGFGYAVLEGPDRIVNWGVKTVANDKNARSLKWIAHFINLYGPDVIVVENYKGKGSRRCRRAKTDRRYPKPRLEPEDQNAFIFTKRRARCFRLSLFSCLNGNRK